MKDGDKCEICSVVYGTESIVMYKPVGRSDFRFQCEGHNRDHLVHKFTIDGKLHRNMKGVRNADSCPVCGYPSGVTGNPKTHAFCHLCKVTFMQRRNTVVLTGLGKFTDTPHWFVGVIEINPED
jgi:ribosomal protein S14